MAIYQVQHIFHSVTGLPEDDVVNTCHFADGDGADVAAATAVAGHVAACFFDAQDAGGNYLESYLSGQVSRSTLPTIKVYDAEEPGSPLYVATAAGVRARLVGGVDLPSEVAVCASYRSDYGGILEVGPDDLDADAAPERPRSRRRNRMFIGPLNSYAITTINGAPMVGPGLQQACNNLIDRLSTVTAGLAAVEASMVVWSGTNQAFQGEAPTSAWVDNAFDIQRRRGVRPTARLTLAL